MKTTTDNFARALIMLRELYGMKTNELATLCNIHPNSISKLERNVNGPSWISFKNILKTFDISYDNLLHIIKTPNRLSNPQILISIRPKRQSEIINADLSYSRVAKIIRILKKLPYMTATLPDTDTNNRLSPSTIYKIETLKIVPSINTIKSLCINYDISLEKYYYYVKATSSMTTIEAAIFIAMDFEF